MMGWVIERALRTTAPRMRNEGREGGKEEGKVRKKEGNGDKSEEGAGK